MSEFKDLSLAAPVLKALQDLGYETPTPIQQETIPALLQGRDLIGQAQTGTGKTAAFALPALTKLNAHKATVQVLVLTPTRELAIQVAEAFKKYSMHLKGLQVLPIYGGQDFGIQLRQLKRGAQVVIGTPGRVMDHLRRKTLQLDALQTLVLDEADEMLRMGFIDDVKWILEQTPPTRQIALFSATLPEEIRRIAKQHLTDPVEIKIKTQTATVSKIRQRFWEVSHHYKVDALTRILEGETFDGVIIFVRTKIESVQLKESLEARGYMAEALNGDIAQNVRERTVNAFKQNKFDMLIATDVAARGLDVSRISHVINYDMPSDVETYIHRIGRTGRAGRSGEAILFVSPRERRLLRVIEQATKQKIELLKPPTENDIYNKRSAEFLQKITDTLAKEDFSAYTKLIEKYSLEHNVPLLEIAAALAKIVQGKRPLTVELKKEPKTFERERQPERKFSKPPFNKEKGKSGFFKKDYKKDYKKYKKSK